MAPHSPIRTVSWLFLSLALTLPGAALAQSPTIVDGAEDRILLRGVVVAPAGPFTGEILVEGNAITCVAVSCAAQPGAAGATQIEVQGAILPGLIDTGSFDAFGVFDPSDWTPTSGYTNHNQWPNEARYGELIDASQYLNGPADVDCEVAKYGEIRALIAGTTSTTARVIGQGCLASLVRSVDIAQNDLGFDRIQVSSTFPPSTGSADSVCAAFAAGTTTAYLVSVGDGVDATARNELQVLYNVTTVDGCLWAPQTSVMHGTAFTWLELSNLVANGMGLIWTPRADLRMYGFTADVVLARTLGLTRIALATDASFNGSSSLLDALRFADDYDRIHLSNVLTPKDLFDMVTSNAASVLGLSAYLGSIEVGKRADLLVIPSPAATPYESLLDTTPGEVRLVMVDGRVLFGDAALSAAGPAAPGCESVAIEGAPKFLCVAETSAANKLDQTYSTIISAIDTAMAAYDATLPIGVTPFGPKAPLVAVATCGNGSLEGGERCDDANLAPGDGCSSVCALEVVPIPALGWLARVALVLGLLAIVCRRNVGVRSEYRLTG